MAQAAQPAGQFITKMTEALRMDRPEKRRWKLLAACALAVMLGGNALAAPPAVVLAAGDVGQCDLPGAALTGALLQKHPGPILGLGDFAYPNGTAEEFRRCYEPAWGDFKQRIYPAPGNHDYRTPGAAGYFGYFGTRAGDTRRGYYSFDVGAWHVVSLNSNRELEPGSPQLQWLDEDLRNNRQRCVLAFWHHPRFSSARRGSDPRTQALWETLYRHGASVVLAAHDHDYERFAPMNDRGERDDGRGIRSFVIGTGGAKLYEAGKRHLLSQVWDGSTWGALKLTLREDAYDWEFLPAADGQFKDAGTASCNRR
jgi:3',5'-cyclic AMP phosphodiesterase CpdA